MSLLTLMQSDAASLVLSTSDAGQSVTHRPLGVAASDVTVTAVWTEEDPNDNADLGEGVVRRGILTVGSGVTANVRDRWYVDAEWWETRRVQQDGGGLQAVFVQRAETEIRSGMKSPSMI